MDKFKMEAASEVGVNLKEGYNGDLSSGLFVISENLPYFLNFKCFGPGLLLSQL